jgi:hypothetical protein
MSSEFSVAETKSVLGYTTNILGYFQDSPTANEGTRILVLVFLGSEGYRS